MHVKLGHALVDILSGSRPTIQHERRCLGVGREIAADDQVGFPLRTLEFNLDVALLLVVLDKRLEVLSTSQNLQRGKRVRQKLSTVCHKPTAHRAEPVTYSRREVEAKTDRAGNGTLPRPVGSENHVEIRARTKLDPVVCQEVPELYADNRARHEPAQFKDSEPPAAHS